MADFYMYQSLFQLYARTGLNYQIPFYSPTVLPPVLRIQDFYPGSKFFPSWIRIKEVFNPKKWFLSSRKYDLGCSSKIKILIFYGCRIQGS